MMLSRRALLSSSLAPLLLAAGDEAAWIQRLGGVVQRDGTRNVTAINLGDTWVNDTDILDLLASQKLLNSLCILARRWSLRLSRFHWLHGSDGSGFESGAAAKVITRPNSLAFFRIHLICCC